MCKIETVLSVVFCFRAFTCIFVTFVAFGSEGRQSISSPISPQSSFSLSFSKQLSAEMLSGKHVHGRALCLECGVSWVRPRQLRKVTALGLLCCFALLFV